MSEWHEIAYAHSNHCQSQWTHGTWQMSKSENLSVQPWMLPLRNTVKRESSMPVVSQNVDGVLAYVKPHSCQMRGFFLLCSLSDSSEGSLRKLIEIWVHFKMPLSRSWLLERGHETKHSDGRTDGLPSWLGSVNVTVKAVSSWSFVFKILFSQMSKNTWLGLKT